MYLHIVICFTVDKGVWIGLTDYQHQQWFLWIDRTPVTITKWMHSEPNNFLGTAEDCVEAISESEVNSQQPYSVICLLSIRANATLCLIRRSHSNHFHCVLLIFRCLLYTFCCQQKA